MSNENLTERVDALLEQLYDLPDEQRRAFLDQKRQEDPEACAEAESIFNFREPASIQQLEAQLAGELTSALLNEQEITDREIDEYVILEQLGRGGMGVVYKAQHKTLDHIVALKMILHSTFAGEQVRQRFLAEAKAIVKLRHANVVQLHDFGQRDNLPYFTLEFMPGGSLKDKLQKSPLSHRDSARIVEQIARGMHYAHQAGIVHRDLKPHNILFAEDETPKVSDFGLAKHVERATGLTATGALLGTPSYMAPEQASGADDVGPRTDVYALGAILYECLTGRPPFEGVSVMDILEKVKSAEPEPPSGLVPTLPYDLETICLHCLQKDPNRRYTDAEALAEDLRRWQASEPIMARPVGWTERSWRWCQRNRTVAILGGAAALFLVVGLVFSTYFALRERQEAKQAKENARLANKETKRADQNFHTVLTTIDSITAEMLRDGRFRHDDTYRDLQENLWDKNIALFEKLLQKSNDPALKSRLARTYWLRAVVRLSKQQNENALSDLRIAHHKFGQLVRAFPNSSEYGILHGWTLKRQADAVFRLERYLDADKTCNEAIKILQRTLAKHPGDGPCAVKLAAAYIGKAAVLQRVGVKDEAMPLYDKGLQLLKRKPTPGKLDPITRLALNVDYDHWHYRRIACQNKADILVRQKRFAETATLFVQLCELEPDVPYHWYSLAMVNLANGDRKAYCRVCGSMIQRFGKTKKPDVAERIVYACVPVAEAVPDWSLLLPLAKQAATLGTGNARLLGAIAYRKGDHTTAVSEFKRAETAQALRAWDLFFLAMAYHGLKQPTKAQRTLEQGLRWQKQHNDAGWTEQIEGRQLRGEAEKLIRRADYRID